jgi:hypothetical protein
MKFKNLFFNLPFFIISAYGFYSLFSQKDIEVEQTHLIEGIVSKIDAYRGKTIFTLEEDSINTYETRIIIRNEDDKKTKVDSLETHQHYTIHYINLDEAKDEIPQRQVIVALSENGNEVLSIEEYNSKSQQSMFIFGCVVGITFLVIGIGSLFYDRYISKTLKNN